MMTDLEAMRSLVERGLTGSDLGQRRNLELAARSVLGGVGGLCTTADIGNDLAMPMYILPYFDDPLISVNPDAPSKVQAMIRGDFSRPAAARVGILGR